MGGGHSDARKEQNETKKQRMNGSDVKDREGAATDSRHENPPANRKLSDSGPTKHPHTRRDQDLDTLSPRSDVLITHAPRPH